MTSETNAQVDSQESFLTALESVLIEARQNDVDIEGGWLIESPHNDHNWDVEIWPVESRESSD